MADSSTSKFSDALEAQCLALQFRVDNRGRGVGAVIIVFVQTYCLGAATRAARRRELQHDAQDEKKNTKKTTVMSS
jgi:hypothetical protein